MRAVIPTLLCLAAIFVSSIGAEAIQPGYDHSIDAGPMRVSLSNDNKESLIVDEPVAVSMMGLPMIAYVVHTKDSWIRVQISATGQEIVNFDPAVYVKKQFSGNPAIFIPIQRVVIDRKNGAYGVWKLSSDVTSDMTQWYASYQVDSKTICLMCTKDNLFEFTEIIQSLHIIKKLQ